MFFSLSWFYFSILFYSRLLHGIRAIFLWPIAFAVVTVVLGVWLLVQPSNLSLCVADDCCWLLLVWLQLLMVVVVGCCSRQIGVVGCSHWLVNLGSFLLLPLLVVLIFLPCFCHWWLSSL